MNGKEVTAYIGLGSNVGDREDNLNRAVQMLGENSGIEIQAVSSYQNTSPVGYKEQPDFLNAAVVVKTTLSAHELLALCGSIEKLLKRKRIIHWGPRTIDMDILLFDDLVLNEDTLIIPHPRMNEREFVLKPLSEIAPDAMHPIYNKTIMELYKELLRKETKDD